MHGKADQLRHTAQRGRDTPCEPCGFTFHPVIAANDTRVRDDADIAALYLPTDRWGEFPDRGIVVVFIACIVFVVEVSDFAECQLEGGSFTQYGSIFGVCLLVG